jgi:hypothetical protein
MSPQSPCDYKAKYRAKVIDTLDPLFKGRLLCEVAALPGVTLNWANPCVPFASEGRGFFALPGIGSDVWVEFENGDADRPIWSGSYWESMLEPFIDLAPEAPELIVALKSALCALLMNDTPGIGGISLLYPDVSVILNATGFTATVAEINSLSITPAGITLRAGPTEISVTPEEGITCTATQVSVAAPRISMNGANVSVTGTTTMTGEVTVTGMLNVQ